MTLRRVLVSCVGAILFDTAAFAQCGSLVQQLIVDKQFDAANGQLDKHLTRAPNDDVAMNCVGRLLMAEGKPGEAVDWFEKAIAINGRNALHHVGVGDALLEYGPMASRLRQPFIIKRVKGAFEQAIALDPTLVPAHHGLFLFLVNAPAFVGGSMTRAREEAVLILKLDSMRGHLDLAILAERDTKDFAGAEKEFLAGIAAKPDLPVPYNAAGAFYRRRERWTDAKAMYAKALQVDPKNETAKKALASLK